MPEITGHEIIIVAENATAKFGGEAILPLQYFLRLRRRGVPTRLIVHERVKAELEADYPEALSDVIFVPDSRIQLALYRLGERLPMRFREYGPLALVGLLTSLKQRDVVKRTLATGFGDLIHQPVPVSPKTPSFAFGFDVPVVIGPMNGGMTYPTAFAYLQTTTERVFFRVARFLADFANLIIRGKRKAALLLVANERSARALPAFASKARRYLPENGVDLDLWRASKGVTTHDAPPEFVFIGRLVDWKAVHIAIESLAIVVRDLPCRLKIIGDGPERPALEKQVEHLGVGRYVEFTGFLSQRECAHHLNQARALLLPSVYECGGAVVLEAMAAGVPVIATDWGGPADYITEHTGFRVKPESEDHMISEFAGHMSALALSPNLAHTFGERGRKRAEDVFDWERKIDQILGIYEQVLERHQTSDRECGSSQRNP